MESEFDRLIEIRILDCPNFDEFIVAVKPFSKRYVTDIQNSIRDDEPAFSECIVLNDYSDAVNVVNRIDNILNVMDSKEVTYEILEDGYPIQRKELKDNLVISKKYKY